MTKVLALDANRRIVEIDITGGSVYRKQEIFTASGTFTLPSTAQALVEYDVIGAGGSGGKTTSTNNAASGGGGGERKKGFVSLTPGSGYTVTVGAGGAARTGTGANAGNDGGDSSIAALVVARGGKAGGVSAAANAYLSGGAAGSGLQAQDNSTVITSAGVYIMQPIVADSAPGSSLIPGATNSTPSPAGSGLEGVCSGGGSATGPSPGKVSLGGAGAGAGAWGTTISVNAGSGTTPGSGGGGLVSSQSGTSSGAGFRGEVKIVYWDTVP